MVCLINELLHFFFQGPCPHRRANQAEIPEVHLEHEDHLVTRPKRDNGGDQEGEYFQILTNL